jgi:hypothetical protein
MSTLQKPLKRRNVIEGYKQVVNEPVIKKFNTLDSCVRNINSNLKIGPYSEYIPLIWVLRASENIMFSCTLYNEEKYPNHVFTNTPANNVLKWYFRNNFDIDYNLFVKDTCEIYVKQENIISAFDVGNKWRLTNSWNIETSLEKEDFKEFRMRSFRGYIGTYTLFDDISPVIIPCIHRSALLEVKYNFLLTGNIDTSYISLFIDKEIENTGYENKNFRAFYKKYLEKTVLESNMNIYYVPKQFILNECFIQPLKLSNNIRIRKQQIEEKINEFKGTPEPESREHEFPFDDIPF